jgi:AraC-like DNA-binding protein
VLIRLHRKLARPPSRIQDAHASQPTFSRCLDRIERTTDARESGTDLAPTHRRICSCAIWPQMPPAYAQPWTLQQMARHCGMGITTFSQYCRELVNTGPVDYLNQCRLNRAACEILESPARPITEIAFTNGFNSSQYFATAFRKRFKTTPRDYRSCHHQGEPSCWPTPDLFLPMKDSVPEPA